MPATYTDLEPSELFWEALAIVNKNVIWNDTSLLALLASEGSQKRLDIFQNTEVTGWGAKQEVLMKAGAKFVDWEDDVNMISREFLECEDTYHACELAEFGNFGSFQRYMAADTHGYKNIKVCHAVDLDCAAVTSLLRVETLVISHAGSSTLVRCPANLKRLAVRPPFFDDPPPTMSFGLLDVSRTLTHCTLSGRSGSVSLSSKLDLSAASASLRTLCIFKVTFLSDDRLLDFSTLENLADFRISQCEHVETILLPPQVENIFADHERRRWGKTPFLDMSRVGSNLKFSASDVSRDGLVLPPSTREVEIHRYVASTDGNKALGEMLSACRSESNLEKFRIEVVDEFCLSVIPRSVHTVHLWSRYLLEFCELEENASAPTQPVVDLRPFENLRELRLSSNNLYNHRYHIEILKLPASVRQVEVENLHIATVSFTDIANLEFVKIIVPCGIPFPVVEVSAPRQLPIIDSIRNFYFSVLLGVEPDAAVGRRRFRRAGGRVLEVVGDRCATWRREQPERWFVQKYRKRRNEIYGARH